MTRRLTLQAMDRLAKVRGGMCLSDVYISAHTKLLWQCAKGHQWLAKPNNIQQNKWCPFCAGHTRLTIDEMHKIAKTHGGKCLSEKYVNNQTKLVWECGRGHRWQATPNNIERGRWCPICAGNSKLTIEDLRQVAKERGGRCLSNEYLNSQTKLLWECSAGHQWEATPNSIRRGSWCRKCAGLEKPPIQQLQETAEQRGGKCLSTTYVNARTKLIWQCSEGHRWGARWDKIHRGQWCPLCSSGLGERICREFFEHLFHRRFPKSRPRWLVNNDGNQMELDGFCKSLRLAFEHQGEHHYSTKTRFLGTEEDLLKRQEDDALKKDLCMKRGITLIQVPAIPNLLSVDQIKMFLKTECNRHGVPIPSNFDSTPIHLMKAYSTPVSRGMLNLLHSIARERGGKCLANIYAGDDSKLLWECKEGHRWEAVPSSIKQGTWCPYCAGIAKKTIEEMRRVAIQRGGKCISKVYVDGNTKLRWQCAKGHRWEATPSHIIRGSWCPYCAGRGKTINELKLIAAARGGKCLSEKYLGARVRHSWQCSKEHKWEATFDSVRCGSWCPVCAGQGKTIEDMQKLARIRGGKCLSTAYVSSRTKLLWECKKAHQWKALPTTIARGSWCPICRSTKLTIEQMYQLAKEHGGKCLQSNIQMPVLSFYGSVSKGIDGKQFPSISKKDAGVRSVLEADERN